VATSPTLSSTVSSWTLTDNGLNTVQTATSAAFSPPARSLITVAVVVTSYGNPTNDPSYSISNTGTALTWTRRAHDKVSTNQGVDLNFAAEVVIYEAWNQNAQTNITIAVQQAPAGGAFISTVWPRAYVWVDSTGAGASHTTSGGSVNTTNNLTVSATAVTNSRLVVAATDGSRDAAPTSSDLTATTFAGGGGGQAGIVGHKLIDSNPETFNLDANGTSAAKWLYAASQVYLKTDPDVGDNGANSGLATPSTLTVPTPAVALDNSQPITVAAIQSTEAVYAATIGYSQTISPAAIASTSEVKPAPIGAPVSNFACDGTPGSFVPFSAGSFNGGTTGVSLFSDWIPTPTGGFMGGNTWEQGSSGVHEFRNDVGSRRGQSYIRPSLVPDFDSGAGWQVHVPATPQTTAFHQRVYFYLEEYPQNDMAFLWYEETYPYASGPIEPVNWVGMCPWGRFELWTNGGNTRTDPNVIPLNQWFRVETRVDATATMCRLIARIYFDAEAPIEGYDIELMSTWTDNPTESAMVPYSPMSGGLGDTLGVPYGSSPFTNSMQKAYFDDVALGPAAFGWIGPSGGALSHNSTTSTATVSTPTVSQTQPLDDVGGIISTATIPAPTVTVPPPLDPITPTAIPTTSTVGAPIVVEVSNRTLDVAGIPSTAVLGDVRILEPDPQGRVSWAPSPPGERVTFA
jgi:hypothetical protein